MIEISCFSAIPKYRLLFFKTIFLNQMEPKTPSEHINVSLEVDGEQPQLISVEGAITVHQLMNRYCAFCYLLANSEST